MLFYLAYRVACGLHKSVHLHFMLGGHTKFSPDWCFGLMKKKFRRTFVSSLPHLVQVVEGSTEGGLNKAQLVGDGQGEVYVETYDWKSFPSSGKKVSNIQKYHHFTFTHDELGVVYAREHVDSSQICVV